MPSTTRPLVFPIKGLHESAGFDIQPEGTTTDALNVRAFDSLAGRARGGRRPGSSKYAYQPATDTNEPVQKLIRAVAGSEYAPPLNKLTEDWQSYDAETNPDLAPRWSLASADDDDTPRIIAVYTDIWATSANGLVWRKAAGPASGDLLAHFAQISSPAEPSVTVNLRAKPDITTGNAGFGGADEPTGVGPYIKASTNLSAFYCAFLTPADVSLNTVALKIYFGSILHSPVASKTITLGGGSTVTTDCSIRLWEYRKAGGVSTIRARLVWPGGGPSGADIDETLEYVDSNADSAVNNNRNYNENGAGVGVFNPFHHIGSDPTFTAGTAFRTIASVDARYETPAPRTVVASWKVSDAGTFQYYRPSGFATLLDDQAGGFTLGSSGRYDSDSAGTDNMVVDTATPGFAASVLFAAPDFVAATLTRPWETGDSLDPEVELDPAVPPTESLTVLRFYLRAQPEDNYGIVVDVFYKRVPTLSPGTSAVLTEIQYSGFGPGGDLAPTTVLVGFPFPYGTRIRVEDGGGVLRVVVAGRVITTISLPTDGTVPENVEGSYTGVAFLYELLSYTGSHFAGIHWVRRSGSQNNSGGFTSSGKLLAVSDGDVVDMTGGLRTPITTGVEALEDGYFNIQAVSAFNSVFFTDGDSIKEYKLSTGAVATPTASDGDFPEGPRLVTLYRGRLVWAGTVADPHNWFMSAVSNPLNYDYSPATPTETQAVAGNNSTAGLIGDVINTLIPFGDDYLIFGCDHSIWQMTGDPAAGGVIDLVSDQTGMAFGSAWAKDPANTLYFWGNDGVYRMQLNGTPQNMTKNRIDFRLRTVALDRNRIIMGWNYLDAELVILVQPDDASEPVRVIVWESRTDAWWEDEYPVAHGPNCLLAYDSSAANDQAFLYGGRDGYIRKVDKAAASDDGTAIESRVRLPMFIAPERNREVVLNALHPVLAKGSSPVSLNIYSGQTAEGCATADTPRASALLAHAGRARSIRRPVRGYAVQAELSSPASVYPWALESIVAEFDPSGLPVRHARVASEGASGGS